MDRDLNSDGTCSHLARVCSHLTHTLFTDLPVEGAPPGTYAWQDGAFLSALKAGDWVSD